MSTTCFVLGAALYFLTAVAGVQGPGTYAHYAVPNSDEVSEDMAAYHVWEIIPTPNETSGNAVFVSLQFWFENGVGGYFGTQVWREGATDPRSGLTVDANETSRVVFSIWDDREHAVGSKGKSCGRFGGEGTGSHCVQPHTFVEGSAYFLRVARVGNNGTDECHRRQGWHSTCRVWPALPAKHEGTFRIWSAAHAGGGISGVLRGHRLREPGCL